MRSPKRMPQRAPRPSSVSVGDGPADDESYSLEGTPDALRIVAAGEAGAVLGVYDLAAAVRDARSVAENLGRTIDSRLGVPHGRPRRRRRRRRRGRLGRGRRLLAQLEGVRRRHPRRRPVHRRGGTRAGPRRVRGVRPARARRGLQRDRHPGLHRVPHLRRRGRRRRRLQPPTTRTSPGHSRCARRSGRCGSTPTTSASTSTSAPTCSC